MDLLIICYFSFSKLEKVNKFDLYLDLKIRKNGNAWLIQINGAGHGLMYQYPEQFSSRIVKISLKINLIKIINFYAFI